MKVAVVIPFYRKEISDIEHCALEQVCDVLRAYSSIVVKPVSLDLSEIKNRYPLLSFVSFTDFYFKSISGYNQLMLSPSFYERFLQYEYILIYQLDAYVFRDELIDWCMKGYDYIGAPWLKKRIYNYPLISWVMSFIRWRRIQAGELSKQDLYNKIGNGGFSLRKVDSHYKATIEYSSNIAAFLLHKRSRFYNYVEDVFWATEIPEFSYPDAMEALSFSFDKYPRYSFRLTKGKLPFGCHGWYKRKRKSFWKSIICVNSCSICF